MPLIPEDQQIFYRMIAVLFDKFNDALQKDISPGTIIRIGNLALKTKTVLERFGVPFIFLFPNKPPYEEYWLAFSRSPALPAVIKPISEELFWKEFPRCFSLLRQSFETSPVRHAATKDPILLNDREPLKNLFSSSLFETVMAIIKEDTVYAFARTRQSVACIKRSLLEGLLNPQDIEFLNTLPSIQKGPESS